MKSVVRPKLPTAAVGSPQAPTAAVDNSAPRLTTPESTYKSGKSVRTTGATSHCMRRRPAAGLSCCTLSSEKTQKTPRQALDTALRRLKEIK